MVSKGKILEGDVKNILGDLANGKTIAEAVKIEKVDHGQIEEKIHKIIKSKPGLSENAYMGLVMKELKGKVDGKIAMEIIRKFVK